MTRDGKLSYEELSKLQYLRCENGFDDFLDISNVDEAGYQQWLKNQETLGAYFFSCVKSLGLVHGDGEFYEVGCGANESAVNNAAKLLFDVNGAKIITPYHKSGFEKSIKDKIIPCSQSLVSTDEQFSNPSICYRKNNKSFNADSTFMMVNPYLDESGRANTSGLLSIYNNLSGNIVYGVYGINGDKDFMLKLKKFTEFKEKLAAYHPDYGKYFKIDVIGDNDAYYIVLLSKDIAKSRGRVPSKGKK